MSPTRSPAPGGGRVLVVGAHLSARGAHRTPGEDLRDRLEQEGDFHVLSCSPYRYGAGRLAHTLITIVRHWGTVDVAVIDVFSGRAFLIAELTSALARRSGARVVLTLHGGGLPDLAERSPKRVQALLSTADRVTSPSRYLATHFNHIRDIDVIPNPIELERFSPPGNPGKPLDASQPAPLLLWIRALHAIYRPWDAVEVLHLVSDRHPAARLRLIGADKGDRSLERIHETAQRLGVAERVEIVPGVPHQAIPGHLQQADVFLNTTTIDNTPVSVLEALAAQVPVATTDVGGIPYLVEHEKSAMISPAADPRSMSTEVLRILEEPSLRERLRQEGLLIAQAHDWSQIWPEWHSLIEAMTRSRSGSLR